MPVAKKLRLDSKDLKGPESTPRRPVYRATPLPEWLVVSPANLRSNIKRAKAKNMRPSMSEFGQSRHIDGAPLTSGLPRLADILGVIWHVSKVPTSDIPQISGERLPN
jgi:hypothetical protein